MSFGSPPAANYFDGHSQNRPFVPIVDTLAAEINQVPREIYHRDATQSTNGRKRVQRLFEQDAVVNTFDRTLLCDALDAIVEWDSDSETFTVEPVSGSAELSAPSDITTAGRLSMTLDVTERLTATFDDVTVLGVLPGPVTTFNHLFTDADINAQQDTNELIREVFGNLARAYGRVDVDAFAVAERVTGEQLPSSVIETDVAALEMLGNIAEFFNVPVTFLPEGFDITVAADIVDRCAVDAVFLDSNDPAALIDQFPEVRLGGGITPELLAESADEIESAITSRFTDAPASVFPASGTEIPAEIHPTKLQTVSQAVETVL